MTAMIRKEKSDVLKELWESIPEYSPKNGLPSAASIIEEGEAISKTKIIGSLRRKNILLRFTSAAAVILLVLCTALFMTRSEVITCIASTDSSKSTFTLPDGTQVHLNRNSRLYYSGELDGRTRNVRLIGEGFFDVAKDSEHPFIVEAHDMDITVLGTRFTVTAYTDEHVSAYLEEGSIKAKGPGLKEDVLLTPNQSLTYHKSKGTYTKKAVNAIHHTSWKNDHLAFKNTSLHDIMESLSHWYQVKITCNDEAFANTTKLSLTVRQESLTEIFNAIRTLVPAMSYSFEDGRNLTITRR